MYLFLFSVNLSAEEVRDYLESQGAENVVLIDNVEGFDTWKKGVFASGRSLRHIRKMTEGILANVSNLEFFTAHKLVFFYVHPFLFTFVLLLAKSSQVKAYHGHRRRERRRLASYRLPYFPRKCYVAK